MDYFFLALGFALLIAGGELLVRGAVATATAFRVSPLLIGLTIVGFGTSTPELVTSLDAALSGSPGIAIGNVIGSNIANILLILGVAAVLAPLTVARKPFIGDGGMAGLAALAGAGLVLFGSIGRVAGAAMLAALLLYIVFSYRREASASPDPVPAPLREAARPAPEDSGPLWRSIGLLLAGVVLTIIGADKLVGAAIALARDWGASEALIGLTIVAVGTSLPELVTSVMAGLRGQSDVALGNIVGSNIFNVFGILGVTALVTPIAIPAEFTSFDLWALLGATAALLAMAATGWRISRLEGALLLASYALYLGVKFS